MDMFLLLGYVGTTLTLIAYLPQIIHLIKEKCSAGISITTYLLWVVSSFLMLLNAVHIHSVIFIAQQSINLLAICIIILFAGKYRGMVCESHKRG